MTIPSNTAPKLQKLFIELRRPKPETKRNNIENSFNAVLSSFKTTIPIDQCR